MAVSEPALSSQYAAQGSSAWPRACGSSCASRALLPCAERLVHLHDQVVAALGWACSAGRQRAARRDQCQNSSQLHRGIMDKSQDEKRALRKQPRVEQRLNMPDRLRRCDLLQRVMRIWLVDRPDTVIGAYWPIKGEFDPLPALHRWKEDGELLDEPQPRRIGLPVVDKVHKTLKFHAWFPGCPMEEDAFGIPKPKDTEVIVPTLLFVPCVGYGAGGFRLGYGGGFYDRTLADAGAQARTRSGLGFTQRLPATISSPSRTTSRWTPSSTTTASSGRSVG